MIIKIKSNSIIDCSNEDIKKNLTYIFNNFISFYIFQIDIEIYIDEIKYFIKNSEVLQFYYLDIPQNIITNQKINDFLIKFKNNKLSCLFGKGPSFVNRDKKKTEIYFGINQTVNILNECDFFVQMIYIIYIKLMIFQS